MKDTFLVRTYILYSVLYYAISCVWFIYIVVSRRFALGVGGARVGGVRESAVARASWARHVRDDDDDDGRAASFVPRIRAVGGGGVIVGDDDDDDEYDGAAIDVDIDIIAHGVDAGTSECEDEGGFRCARARGVWGVTGAEAARV